MTLDICKWTATSPTCLRLPSRQIQVLSWYNAAGNEFCERLAFYGMATNLVIYLMREMGANPATASIQQVT